MLHQLKKWAGLSPPVEWRCGKIRQRDLLQTVGRGSVSTLTLFHRGEPVWTRDVSLQLHEFTCHCLEYLLSPPPWPLPPVTPATAQAPDAAESSHLPASISEALRVKRRWIRGQADTGDLQRAAAAVETDTRTWWPSSFCFGINALVSAGMCVGEAMNLERPGYSAAQCARCVAEYFAQIGACSLLKCDESGEESPGMNPDGQTPGIAVRSVACPHLDEPRLQKQAGRSLNPVRNEWWAQLNHELSEIVASPEI